LNNLSTYYDYWLRVAARVTKNFNRDTHIDLVHHCIEVISRSTDFERLCASGEIKPYLTRAIVLQYYDKKSSYHKCHDLHAGVTEYSPPETTEPDNFYLTREQLDIIISRLSEFERDIFNDYLSSGLTLKDYANKLSKEIGTSPQYIVRNIQYSREKILSYVHR
jgi:hypothetical protein